MATPIVRRNVERRLYTVAALVALLIVFAGFARTYYLKLAFGTPPLTGLQQLHGLVMSSWFVLFLVQVRLVAGGRTDLHRRLGLLGAVIAVAMLVVGTTTAITGARLGHTGRLHWSSSSSRSATWRCSPCWSAPACGSAAAATSTSG